MKKFLLLTLIMCLLGGLSSSLMAQFNLTYNQGASNQYTLTFTPTSDNECAVQMNKGNAPGASTDLVIPATVENNGQTYNVVSIPNNAFSGASSYIGTASDYFTSLTIPNTVVSIGSSAFRYWSNCTTVILGEGVTSISNNAFANSSSITTIYCYANTPPTCGGNAVFNTTVKNNAKVYVPANSLNEYKKEATSGSGVGWAYININNFYAMSSTPTLPDAPTLTSPTNGAKDIFNPSLNFSLGNNTTHYQVLIAEANGTGTPIGDYTTLIDWTKKTSTVSYQTNNLKPNTTYSWKVVAKNGEGNDALTTESSASFTTRNITSSPSAITNVSPTNGATDLVNPLLSWEFGLNTEEYQVLIDGVDVTEWINPGSSTTGSYQTSGLSAGEHTWKVNARNSAGTTEGAVYTFSAVSLPDNVTPISPADGATATSNIISFNFAKGTDKYRILYDRGNGFEYLNGNDWKSTNDATTGEFTLPEFETGKTYYWAVEVWNEIGQRTKFEVGEEIAIYSFTVSSILPVKYTSPIEDKITDINPSLTWAYQGEVSQYQVLLGTTNPPTDVVQEWTNVSGTNGSYQASGLQTAKYYWQVNIKSDETTVNGDVMSFVSLKNPEVAENIMNIYETSARINWSTISGATSYNVYLGNELIETKGSNVNYCEITGLNYNNDYNVKVTAIYDLGESLGSNIEVHVSGFTSVSGTIENNLNNNAIAGAKVQYVGTTLLGDEKTIEFTTGNDGTFSGKVPYGTYTMIVSADGYKTNRTEKEYNTDSATNNVTLEADLDVTPITPKNDTTEVTSPIIKWKISSNATAYRFLYGESKDALAYCGYGNADTWLPTNSATDTIEVKAPYFKADKTYYWAVEVKNDAIEKVYYKNNAPSGDVTAYSFTTSKILPITNTSPANGATDQESPILSWSYPSDDITQYQVVFGTTNPPTEEKGWNDRTIIGTGLSETDEYTITEELSGDVTYYWRVDAKYSDGTIKEGDVWSFTTLRFAPVAQANPTQVIPTDEGGSTTISWTCPDGAMGYNIYNNGIKVNTELIPSTTYTYEITGLAYSFIGYNITVEAIYNTGTASSNTIVVKVTGKGFIEATVKGSDNNPIEGAIVTLTCTKDEFGNADNVTQHIFETDADGNISGNISNGSYSVKVTKLLYSDYNSTEDIIIENASTTRLNITLEQRLPDNVTPISPENEEENITSTTIRWQFDNNTLEYRFLYGTNQMQLQYWNGTSNSSGWLSTNGATEAEITIEDLDASKTYYWCVDVKNNKGQRTMYETTGEDVEIYSFTTNNILPAKNVSPENNATNLDNPVLTWDYVGDARQYRVFLGTDQNSLTAQIEWTDREEEATGFVSRETYQTENLNNATTYYWRVDVKDANDNVYQGKTWSFATLLPAPEATANPAEVVPSSSMTYGSTTISWDEIEGAIGYNVYLGDEKLNAELISDDSYTIEANTLKLAYNMNPGHKIYVEAVYSLGTSMSDAIYVKVTGTGLVNATIYSNDYNHRLEGATVTLTCTKDEFGNVYDGNGTQYVFTTNKDGQIEDGNGGTETRIFNGTYSVIVEKEHYDTYTGTVTIEQDKTTNVNGSNGVILVTTPPSDVTPLSPIDDAEDVSSKTIRWRFAEGTTEYRFLYGQSEDALEYLNKNTAWIPTNGVSEMEAELPSLSINTEYFWAVDVKNALGGQRTVYEATGQKVAIYSFTANATLAVVNVSPDNGSIKQDDPVLTWNYVGDARQYRVYLGTEQNSLTAQIEWTDREEEATGFVRTGTYQTENLTGTTTYYWRVDVKDAKGTVHTGETWSFATPLTVPTNLVAGNDSIYPTAATNYVTGNTTISWTGTAGATAYNVYIDENAPSTTTDTSYVVSLERDLNGHSIQVSAIYEGLGESEKSDACIIKVIGYSNVNGTIKDEEGTLLEGATVTFTGKDAFKAEQSLSFATDASGKYNGYVPEGDYIMTVSFDDYLDYTEEDITIVYDATRTKDVTLYSRHIFSVDIDLDAISFNNIDIYLYNTNWDNNADYSGTYFVYYQKDNGEVIKDSNGSYFNKYSTLNSILLLGKNENFRKTWEGLPNGLYKIGVASDADKKIYWSETIVERRYFVLTNDGNWEDDSSWSNGERPLNTDNVFVNANATINSDITVQNVVIVKNEENVYNNSLTIENGGKLTATDVINESAITSFIIKDGGQLHRTGNNLKELNGKFVMNITNPTEWTDKNKTGWQLISVPFSADANISEFTDVDDRYDFYKFDGNNQYKEWINFKDTTNVDLETSFKQGRGYLVSYKVFNTFSPTGVFNPSSSHDFDITTGDKRMSGFQLLGNPFSFNMEWNKVEHSDLVDGFAVVNESGTYNYYDGSNGTIPVGDGFFVKAIGENPTMHYDANLRSRSEQIESINVIASSNKGNDNVIISFAGADKEGFPKLDNFNDKVANIFVNNNDIRYGIFNYDRNTTEVELSFLASVMGRYTISMKANGEFDNLVLVDRFTGIETNMLLEDYSFTASGKQDHNRFVVRLSMNNNDVQEESFVYQSGNELIINGEGFVQIIDIMGRIVYTNDIQGESRIDASNFYSATYVVRVVNENEVKTQKIVIY